MPSTDPARRREVLAAHRARRTAFITEYKASRGCANCGEHDPVVLDLNHVDPALKNKRIKALSWLGHLSRADLLVELEKCEVLCANCHRRVTAVQQSWAALGV